MTDDHKPLRDTELDSLLRSIERDDGELLEPPASVWAGIEDELAAAGDAPESPAVSTELPDPSTADASSSNVVPFRRPRRGLILAAAAAACLIAGIAGYAALRDSNDGIEREVVSSVDLDNAGLQVENVASGVARLVQTDNETWEVELQVVDLDESDLDPGDDDVTLELWVLAPGATDMHSIGVLDTASAADGRFALPEGVDPTDFPIVDISLEPDDGDPTHSGQSLLRGELTF